MRFFPHTSPWLLQHWIYPSLTWKRNISGKTLYLTFDDGPIPEVTPMVLDILQHFGVPATFFCVGDNVRKHPDVFGQLLARGHAVGNHTFHHLDGWKTNLATYLENTALCQQQLTRQGAVLPSRPLFRPPYGKISRSQIKGLSPHYEIIMWDVLTGDFSESITPEACLEAVCQYSQPGSVIVFHDHIKARRNMEYALPRFIEFAQQQGYGFDRLYPVGA